MRRFDSLTEREVLALAISLEEEDARIFDDIAAALQKAHPEAAEEFRKIRMEEDGHRHRLIERFKTRFGEHIPLIRRQDVAGFVARKPVWPDHPLTLAEAAERGAWMEAEAKRFYEAAARHTTDAGTRQLLGDLAEEERKHERTAEGLETTVHADDTAARRKLFVLQVIQPGLAGLMDGSVSTLAPLFAAAFATQNNWDTFVVGLAASIGAGISMGFAEALSDDGSLTGRGRPWVRGLICGLMTMTGGLGHTMPYVVPSGARLGVLNGFHLATIIACVVVMVELVTIAWIRHRYMESSWWSAIFQVVLGGLLVFATGVLIGSS